MRLVRCHTQWLGPIVAIALTWPSTAHASGGPVGDGHMCFVCALWVPVGLNVGAAIHPGDGTGFLIGGEVSVLDLRHPGDGALNAWGGYVDFLHDSLSASWRLSAGPEIVFAPGVGFDAGPELELSGAGPHFGMRLRYFAPFVFAAPYLASELMFTGRERLVVEAGLLLKAPIPISS
jgi:hypothetical protein